MGDVESVLRLLAEPPPAVPVSGAAALAELLVRRGVLDRPLADAVLAGPWSDRLGRRLAGLRGAVAGLFEEHVLGELGRLPSWYRVRIGDPGGPAGAWIDRYGRSLRVEVRGSAEPGSTALRHAMGEQPVMLIVPGRSAEPRHPRLAVVDWDSDGVRLQQLIEPLILGNGPGS